MAIFKSLKLLLLKTLIILKRMVAALRLLANLPKAKVPVPI